MTIQDKTQTKQKQQQKQKQNKDEQWNLNGLTKINEQ